MQRSFPKGFFLRAVCCSGTHAGLLATAPVPGRLALHGGTDFALRALARKGRLLRHLFFLLLPALLPMPADKAMARGGPIARNGGVCAACGAPCRCPAGITLRFPGAKKMSRQAAAACGCQGSSTEEIPPWSVPASRPGAVAATEARPQQHTAPSKRPIERPSAAAWQGSGGA